MIRRKVCSELGLQADHVKSDKSTENLKLAYSKHQDSKGRGTYGMKKMKKSSLIKLSDLDLETLQSPPPRRCLSRSKKRLPLHVPTTAVTPQKHKPLLRKSPNYMKPTSSSDAKKELLPVSLRNNQFGSDGKNLPQKSLSNSKSSSVSNRKAAKTMSRSSSVNLVKTLTKTLGFKPSTTCRRKSTATVLHADINAPYRATCSSILKDSKFPAHLLLNTGGSDSEGALIMKVCPYIYCSLNGNHHPPEKRRFLKTRKSIKLEVSENLKAPCETRKDFNIKPVVFDGKPACDEVDRGNPTSALIREIGIDFSIQVNDKEMEKAYITRRSDAVKHLENQEGIKFAMDGNSDIAEEEGVYLETPSMPCDLNKSEINPNVEFKNYFDVAEIEVETKESFHQKLNTEDADKSHPPSWFHERICTGSHSHEVTYDEEHMENIGLDDSNSKGTDMEWEEEQFCPVNHKEEDIGSSVITQETDSNFKSLSEGSHDIFEMRLDDILSNHYAYNMVEKALQGKEKKNTYFDAQPRDTNFVQESSSESIQVDYPSNGTDHEYDPPYLEEEEFQFLTNIEDNVREIEKHVDNGASCALMVLDEDTVHNSEAHKISETHKIEESHEDINTNLENNDKEIIQRNQILSSDVPKESTIIVQDHELLEEDQVIAIKFQTIRCKSREGQNTGNNWQWLAKNKRITHDVEEMTKINPRKPNFLPLIPDPETEKVELRHQIIDDRKNAEEWMLDFSLRQAVTKLAPARKKNVALLVEAFETVMSTSK